MEISIEGYTAKFVNSEEAGYSKGKLLLDMPNGDMISVYRSGRKWIKARIRNGIARNSSEFSTRQEALNSAAEDFSAESIGMA